MAKLEARRTSRHPGSKRHLRQRPERRDEPARLDVTWLAAPREQLLELCFTVSLAALVNRVHATVQTDLDPETEAAVGAAPSCPIGR